MYKEAGSLVALDLREAPAESGRATDTAAYGCPYPITSPLHNYSSSNHGNKENATPDQERAGREYPEPVSGKPLTKLWWAPLYRLVWTLV